MASFSQELKTSTGHPSIEKTRSFRWLDYPSVVRWLRSSACKPQHCHWKHAKRNNISATALTWKNGDLLKRRYGTHCAAKLRVPWKENWILSKTHFLWVLPLRKEFVFALLFEICLLLELALKLCLAFSTLFDCPSLPPALFALS